MLELWRSPAFYGDDKLNVGALFNDVEAALAISYAELAQLLCAIVRGYVLSESREHMKGTRLDRVGSSKQELKSGIV
jgi:hypothetical protein